MTGAVWLAMAVAALLAGCAVRGGPGDEGAAGPFVVVLGIAQDGGVPQAGSLSAPGWGDPSRRRMVACLGVVNPGTGERWMIDATPDFPEQLERLHRAAGGVVGTAGPVTGIFLTHAHIGHYTGLMHLGHEAMGAKGVAVYAMPRMKRFLEENGPWSQLVKYGNIALRELEAGKAVELSGGVRVVPVLVPHRQEFSEVVGFRIEGQGRGVLVIPDIDAWEQWDAMGVRLEDELARVDVAYLDGTFFANGEIPGRDMTGFPHPFITKTMERLAGLPAGERGKVRFIHLNHTNPALWEGSGARKEVERRGFGVAEEGERVKLSR